MKPYREAGLIRCRHQRCTKWSEVEAMTGEWHQTVGSTIATMPRLGWRGRWDALLYALRVHKFLRTKETPLTFSVWVNGGDAEVKICGVVAETGATCPVR